LVVELPVRNIPAVAFVAPVTRRIFLKHLKFKTTFAAIVTK
jgi:hypothetical protein